MFEKMKNISSQVAAKANDAVKGGVESLALTASDMGDALNEKAVRASTAQMCHILEIAMDELKTRPLSAQAVSLKTSVNIGITSLEMEIVVPPAAKNESNTPGAD